MDGHAFGASIAAPFSAQRRARNLPARSRPRQRRGATSPPRSPTPSRRRIPPSCARSSGVAHAQLDRLRELVEHGPSSPTRLWDWGSAIGSRRWARVAHGTARHRRDPARARRAARRLHRGDDGRPRPRSARRSRRSLACSERVARTASRSSRTPAPAARRRGRSCNISSRSVTPIRCIPPWSSAPRINAACRECSSSTPNRTIAS